MSITVKSHIPCYILAGGQGRRMASKCHKALSPLDGLPLIDHLVRKLAQQTTGELVINTSDDLAFQTLGLRLIEDASLAEGKGRHQTALTTAGPLHGVYSAMEDSAQHSGNYLITISCDTPFIPHDLIKRLLQTAENASHRCAIAVSNQRVHPIIGCWHHSQKQRLKAWLTQGNRRALSWATTACAETVVFDNHCHSTGELDPFFNINSPSDLAYAHEWSRFLY